MLLNSMISYMFFLRKLTEAPHKKLRRTRMRSLFFKKGSSPLAPWRGSCLFFIICAWAYKCPGSLPPCSSYPTLDLCSGSCMWDCRRDQCREPICEDYEDNVSCPSGCKWNCFTRRCQTSDNWDVINPLDVIERNTASLLP